MELRIFMAKNIFLDRILVSSRAANACMMLALLLTFYFSSPASAQAQIPDNESTVGVQGGRYGLGFASSWPAYGISGTLQVSETITGEAVLGFFGTVSSFGGRLWYRFNRNLKYDIYGYGGVSVYHWNGVNSSVDVSENVLGVGFGAGIESGLPKLFDDEEFPPIFINAEVGLAFASFKYYANFSSFILGIGAHYRFGTKN